LLVLLFIVPRVVLLFIAVTSHCSICLIARLLSLLCYGLL
jgi:hypothetical protein